MAAPSSTSKSKQRKRALATTTLVTASKIRRSVGTGSTPVSDSDSNSSFDSSEFELLDGESELPRSSKFADKVESVDFDRMASNGSIELDTRHDRIAGERRIGAVEAAVKNLVSSSKDHRVLDIMVSRILPDRVFILVEILKKNLKYTSTKLTPTMTFDTKLLLINVNGAIEQSITIPNVQGEYQTKRLLLDYVWNGLLEDKKASAVVSQHRILVIQVNQGPVYLHNEANAVRLCSWLLSSTENRGDRKDVVFLPSCDREIKTSDTNHFICVDLYTSIERGEPKQICLTDPTKSSLDRSVTFSGLHLGIYDCVLKNDKKNDKADWVVFGFKHYVYEVMLHGYLYKQRRRIQPNFIYEADLEEANAEVSKRKCTDSNDIRIRGIGQWSRVNADEQAKVLFISIIRLSSRSREIHVLEANSQKLFSFVRKVHLDFAPLPYHVSTHYEPLWQPESLFIDKDRQNLYLFHTAPSVNGASTQIQLERLAIHDDLAITHEETTRESEILSAQMRSVSSLLHGPRHPFVRGMFDQQTWSTMIVWRAGGLCLLNFQQ